MFFQNAFFKDASSLSKGHSTSKAIMILNIYHSIMVLFSIFSVNALSDN